MEMERLHQMTENAAVNGQAAEAGQIRSNFPDALRRRFEVYLTLPATSKVMPMRGVTSNHLGALVKLKARVVG